MKGIILGYSVPANQGEISGDDGMRYSFSGAEWKPPGVPVVGQRVDFVAQERSALSVYLAVEASAAPAGSKSRVAAALFAFFLGSLGIHKFYLGRNKAGVIMLICGTLGWLLVLPGVVVSVVALIEFIIYLTKTDAEFYRTYIEEKKEWF